jgi:nitric oxide dioxygenase
MITTRQIERVQASFALVLPHTATVAADFYQRLFAIAPDTRSLFREDMADQGRKLFLTLAVIVDALHTLERVLPVAEALAVRHVGFGVREEHYASVGEALLAALAHALGPRFDRETEEGWATAYRLLSGCMISAARQAMANASSPYDDARHARF